MAETPLFALLGPAGTGKTYSIQQKLLKSPKFAKLCATTGIAAINLGSAGGGEGVTTLQSTLGFFDLPSLRENATMGKLRRALFALRADYRFLVIDEMSMLDAETLDILVTGLDEVNANLSEDHGEKPLGMILVGDFLQLPPVDDKNDPSRKEYCFEAENWKRFKVTKLTEIKRQSDPVFQSLLASARVGDGTAVAKILKQAGCFVSTPSLATDITTIYATNKDVDSWNDTQFRKLLTTGAARFGIAASRWGKARKEWKVIPDKLDLAIGAYVMILANDTGDWAYVNGDCGTVVKVLKMGPEAGERAGEVTGVQVQLKRNNRLVTIGKIARCCFQKETPPGFTIPECLSHKEFKEQEQARGVDSDNWKELYDSYLGTRTYRQKLSRLKPTDPYYNFLEEKWVIGEILYCPLRLAYASSVHKTQGLTLDNIQIVPNHKFFGSPNMMYVALSRCRTLEGLRVVGTPGDVVRYTNTMKKLERWF